jgi:molybdopterin/thiamine biosynthesis adenylyltransferase
MTPSERIVIVGLGALGSHVALLLRNEKPKLRLVDFDSIEQKNCQAQFHSKQMLRANKATSLNKNLNFLFGTQTEVFQVKLSKDNTSQILGGSYLVLDCTDNVEARNVIKDYTWQHHIPCLHGALSADGSFARIIWDEDFVADDEKEEGAETCVDGENLPFFAASAALMAMVVQRFLKNNARHSYQLTPSGTTRLT